MQVKDKPVLRLVKSSETKAEAGVRRAEDATAHYYRRIKNYAERIRRSDDIDAVIRLLETALHETAGLHRDQRVALAREEVHRAERRIEALRKELEEARRLIHVDHLTGALNRAGFESIYEREAALADRHEVAFGVALIDLDNFKMLNDVHGHQAGDAALMHLARIMKLSLRPSDVVVRFGGEEFLVILPHASLQRAVRALERVQQKLAARVLIYEHRPVRFSFSAGVTERRPGEPRAAVIQRADRALYLAKNTGKQRVVAYA